MLRPQKIRLGDLLIAHHVISESQLNLALSNQRDSGKKLGRELVKLGYLSNDYLVSFLSKQLDIPQIDLSQVNLELATVVKLPEIHSRRLQALVFKAHDTHYEVCMADPTDIFAYDELVRLLDKPFHLVITKQDDLLNAFDNIFRRTHEMQSLASEVSKNVIHEQIIVDRRDAVDTESEDTPVARFLQTMFEDAVQMGASDIHLEPFGDQISIRLRQDGVLQQQAIVDRVIADALVSRLKLMARLDISEKRLPQDGRFHIDIGEYTIDVRLSTIPVEKGESAVMRILDQSKEVLGLGSVGMRGSVLEKFRNMIHSPHGMVLVTGPTGSGKTTSLYAGLKELNSSEYKILTAEDPIEYRLPGLNQVQVNMKIDLSFARILRAFLRQDPDIILVGEMRDKKTVEIGLRAAMTGHLVLSSLHTNDAISTPIRLLDMGAEPFLIAAALRGVLAQRLVRKICQQCAKDYQPTEREIALLKSRWGDQVDTFKFQKGTGCLQCNRTGYHGRTPIHEILEMTGELVRHLQNNDVAKYMSAANRQAGFKSLRSRAMALAARGITTVDQVLRVTFGSGS